MRDVARGVADVRLSELGQPHQQMALAPRVVRPPAGATRLAAHARIEHVACGEVAVGHVCGRKFREVALFAAQSPQGAEEAAIVLGVAVGRCRCEQDEETQKDGKYSAFARRTRALQCALYITARGAYARQGR